MWTGKKKTIQHAYIDKDMAKNHRECCKFSIHKPVWKESINHVLQKKENDHIMEGQKCWKEWGTNKMISKRVNLNKCSKTVIIMSYGVFFLYKKK